MEYFCSPYSYEASLNSKCFGDFLVPSIDAIVFLIAITAESFVKTLKSSHNITESLLINLITVVLSYFTLLTLLLFYIPVDSVSFGQILTISLKLVLWATVSNFYYNYFAYHQFGCTSLITLKLFTVTRIISSTYNLYITTATDFENDLVIKSLDIICNLLIVLFFSSIFIKKIPENRERLIDGDQELNTYERSSFFSKVTMYWAYPILKLGNTRTIEFTDIEDVRELESCAYQNQKLQEYIEKVYMDSDPYGLLKAMYKRFWKEIIGVTIIGVFSTILEFSSPVFVALLENFLNSDQPMWRGIALVCYLIISKFVRCLISNQSSFYKSLLSYHIKSALSTEIYEKLLKISVNGISKKNDSTFSYGKIINLIQVDLDSITSGILNVMSLIVLPFNWGIGFYLLFETTGWKAGATGTSMIFILMGLNLVLTKKLSSMQKILMEKKDKRIKLCNELLGNIRIFKIYNWENKLCERVFKSRDQELDHQKSIVVLNIFIIFLSWGAQNYLSVATITTMTLTGVTLTAANVYAGLSVLRVLRTSMVNLPSILNSFVQTKVSLNRIQEYFRSKNQSNYVEKIFGSSSILLKNASFSWETFKPDGKGEMTETKRILKDINLKVNDGELVAVVGKVASGKSSLLQALIQNMIYIKNDESKVAIKGSLAYCNQEAWIQNKTIRDNILFGKEFEEERYSEVIRVCMLKNDLDILPGGDLTEIGERGINLSGGQKARVSIARTIYSGADILLFDDPLAALDQYVAKKLFEECIIKFLSNKTRIVVTNNQQFLSHAHRILVLNDGVIVQEGKFEELIKNEGYFKNEFMVDLKQTQFNDKAQEVEVQKAPTREKRLIESEERAIGSVKFSVYKNYYVNSAGMFLLTLGLVSMILWQIDRIGTDLYLAYWTNQSTSEQNSLLLENILIYGIGSFSINIFILLRSLSTFYAGIRASKLMFTKMLKSLLDASIPLYYDINPMGRILNRLSKDQNVVDSSVPSGTNFTITQLFTTTMIIFFCIYTVPLVTLILPLVLYLALKIQSFYLASSRDLTRMESISKSPIIQHFSETLNGISTIRAFGYQNDFINKYYKLTDKNTSLLFCKNGCYNWLAIALELISDIILMVSSLIIVFSRDKIDPGLVGTCLVYIMMLPDNIYLAIFVTSSLENSMVSVERITDMTNIPKEDLRIRYKDDSLIARNWPEQGSIEFYKYTTKYRPDTELVLKSISVVIKPQEKVGIMGKTGSGKSSLVNSLFRVIESTGGWISIDGIDIAEIGLDLLRQKICVIPQDPALFQGKLRDNIDPLNQFTDEEILKTVKLVQLDVGEDFLSMEIGENASNFSVGQKQLICISRALLRKCKIIVLDEATASIDFKTDLIIQEIIKEKFLDCTVLTIAHRINTIINSDRIMILENGFLVEFDTPENLKKNSEKFRNLTSNY